MVIAVNSLIRHVSKAICEVARFFNLGINIPFLFQLRIFVSTIFSFENNFFMQVVILYQINMTKGTIAENAVNTLLVVTPYLISRNRPILSFPLSLNCENSLDFVNNAISVNSSAFIFRMCIGDLLSFYNFI